MKKAVTCLIVALLCIAVAAVVLLYGFRIKSIDVSGNSRYSGEQIRDDLINDFKTENTLYFSWKYRTAGPSEDAPYLSSVEARMISPSSVKITVSENQLVGVIRRGTSYVYFDTSGVVQMITKEKLEGIPEVSGVSISEPVLYQKLGLDNPSTIRTILSISTLLIQADLIPDNVKFTEDGNMTLEIGQILVKLGQDEYLEEKIANLVQIYPTIRRTSGTLNMEGFTGKNEAITFRQEGEEIPESESEVSEGELIDTSDAGSTTLAGVGAASSGESAGNSESPENPDDQSAPENQENPENPEEQEAQENPEEPENPENVEEAAEAEVKDEGANAYGFQAFDSNGRLRQDARVRDGVVVDGTGTPIPGCRVDENGNVVDAYMNVIDPYTGTLAE